MNNKMISNEVLTIFPLLGSHLESNPIIENQTNTRSIISLPSKDQKHCIHLDLTTLSKHVLLAGGIGSGKTNTIIKFLKDLSYLDNDSTMMVFDTKGDFFQFYNPRKDVLISANRSYNSQTNYFNIFKEIKAYSDDPDEQDVFIKEIAANFFADRKNESQPFFTNAPRQLFANILSAFHYGKLYFDEENHLYVRSSQNSLSSAMRLDGNYKTYLSNHTIYQLFKNYSDQEIADKLKQCGYVSTRSVLGDGSSNQALGVMGELRVMIEDYFINAFAKGDPKKDVSIIETLRKKGGVKIFVEYDISKGEVLSPVYRFLFDIAFKETLGRNKSEGNCYFIIDELKLLPKLQYLESALNFGRSLGVKLICGIQNIHQIYDVYGEQRALSILAGFNTTFIYYLLDHTTREFFIKNMGENYLDYYFTTTDGDQKKLHIQKNGHSVEDADILDLTTGQAIVQMNGRPPFKYHFAKFDDE